MSRYGILSLSALMFVLSIIFNKQLNRANAVERVARLAENYIQKQQKDFEKFLKDTAFVNSLLSNDETLKDVTRLSKKAYEIFLFRANRLGEEELTFWNGQKTLPTPELKSAIDGDYFLRLANGWYLTTKKTLQHQNSRNGVMAFAMIPVQTDYFIETNYLPTHFVFSSDADKTASLSEIPTNYPVHSISGKSVFWLTPRQADAIVYNNWLTNFFRICAALLFFLSMHFFAEALAKKRGAWKSIAMLAAVLIVFRYIIYLIPSLLYLRQFELFSPLIYGSNFIQKSLGDLCINAALFCWLIVYAWSKLKNENKDSDYIKSRIKWGYGIVTVLLFVSATFLLATVIRSMVADSKISFDVTNFFGLSIYTVIGFALLACLSLSYYFFSRLILKYTYRFFGGKELWIYLVIAVSGLLYLTYRSGNNDVLFHLPVLCWLLFYSWLLNRKGVVINKVKINITGVLTWIFLFSVSIAAIMLVEIKKVEKEKRKRMAEKLAVQTDPSGELLMNIALQYLDNDFLSENFSRFSDESKGKLLRDSIIAGNYEGYLNKYDTRLYVYDVLDKPQHNEDVTSYAALNTILNVQAKPTSKDGLYYYETAYDRFSYITKREVNDTAGKKLGTFFVVSNLKSYSRDALFPELFRQFGTNEADNAQVYATAVYVNQQLHSPPGNYPFATSITNEQLPKNEFEERANGEYNELWFRYSNDKVIVVARKVETMIAAITLFSYLFCSFIFLVMLVRAISFLLSRGWGVNRFRGLLQMNIRAQIHSTIIFVSVISFLIIGVATITFFINRYYRNNSDKLSRTMQIMVNEMEKRMAEHSTFDDLFTIYDSVSNTGLQQLVNDVSDIHGVDVNVYDLQGSLQLSSEANVYTKGVLSKKMDPLAYYHLNKMRQVQHVQEEKIGNFSYLSIYSPVREKERNGKPYAYINIPYFTSKPQLQQQISNFLVTIINLNAFIFLIGGLISLFITNRITGSFSIISNKMKEVNLSKMNEQISWNRNDEIGELVTEYNKMVAKLGDSAALLAKSEREGAWREMARQVAHEIKNPLTPMKLSIQYLQKAINNNNENVKELTAKVANTLVEQIDHLSKIAADFSQFANIGNTHTEYFDLHEVIISLKELYQPNADVTISWYPINDRAMVFADKTQMNRLFTNLFTNAVQACKAGDVCKISVEEKREHDKIIISIKDNGEGISEEIRSNIFVPNFTTKSSGTGLGLAMCKGIVEQAKGDIWFETILGIGSVFYVSLPLLNEVV
ncbi:MAG TPA: HAMP domain-containing sensor histidine kinase [Chitinophagaceae bacterium]|nr:HAMP domain-containing sensor histidine kinase [Chitinophagaceae bacterium]